ncbi:acyltransferase family protein [Brochothrix campestris]|uniref:Acyltransferase n=1 Tax=Brochothrix campestris FSL F6-1037 TaxID=1265861 RepID=W7CQA2_9LIST|nr:acyltransferase [Brochothrix campestris]EUJ39267.1 acyltransferase [Brochothrix campestris FSL F6-1037]
MPGLDGLRAVAILVVFAYHLHAPWAQGGFIGVDIFFILSGYLITSAILREWQQTQSFDFKKFLYRRFKRLIPAVYFLIIVVVVYVLLFKPVILHTLRGDALASLFYSSNWWFIFHDVSYFDSFGAGSPLKNLWSLAIEEQFYFVWPIILLILLKYCQNKKQLLGVVVVMIILSISLMAWLFVPGSDPSRVYYGTDTRCFALLFGALLAIAIPTNRLLKPLPATAVKTLNYIGLGAFTLLLIGVLTLSELSSFLYYGGFVLVAFLAMIAVFVSAHPLTIWSKILATPPLHYFGTRSYSLYLWHYPVIILTTPITAAGVFSPTRSLLQFSITLVLAELSFRYVEAPIRQHGFKHVFRHFLPQQFKQTQPLLKSCFIALIVLFGIALGNVMTIFEEPTPKPITTVKITQKASKKNTTDTD